MQERLRQYYPTIIIAVITLLLYIPFIGNGYFNIDDAGLIWNNNAVTLFDIPRVFTSYDPELYIPLTLFTYQIEYLISGGAPVLVHITNIVLHTFSSVLVFLIAQKLTRSTVIGLMTALLFVIHPMQSTAVLWASARKDLLSSALMLLSLHLYLRENKWSLAAFAAALLSKVSVAVLPLLLLLVDVWEGKPMHRERLREKWPYFGLSILFGVIAIIGKTQNLSSLTPWDYVLLSAKNITFSLQKLFVPTGLSFMYPQTRDITITAPEFFVPLLVLILVAAALFALRKKQQMLLWSTAWFLICMAPNLLTYSQNGNVIFASNRYVYLACIGVFLYVCSLLGLLIVRWRNSGVVIIALLMSILSVLTIAEARAWHSSASVLRKTLAAGYDHPVIYHNLAAALREEGDTDGAFDAFLTAGRNGYSHSYKLAGDIALERGNQEEALQFYQLGMQAAKQRGAFGSTDLAAHFAIAALLSQQNRDVQAEQVLLEARQLGQHIPSTHINLGALYLRQGKLTSARNAFNRAVQLNRFSASAWYHLAYLDGQEGNLDDARAALKRVLRIDPNYEGAHENLEQIEKM